MRAEALAIAAAMVTGGMLRAELPSKRVVGPCTPQIEKLCTAYADRAPELHDVARELFMSSDGRTRFQTFEFLWARRWKIDIEPLAEVIEKAAETYRDREGLALLDFARLEHMPVGERQRIYTAALRDEETCLAHGTTLHRMTAATMAAEDGIEALREEVDRAVELLPPKYRGMLSLSVMHLQMELGAGGVDRSDAVRRAAERLAKMPFEEFLGRIAGEPEFGECVLRVSEQACVDGLSKQGCEALKGISAKTRDEARKGRGAPAGQDWRWHQWRSLLTFEEARTRK